MSSDPIPLERTAALLARAERGDSAAADELMQLVYHELRRLADHLLRQQRPGYALQATELVHEAYMRLVGQTRTEWRGRAHFFALAARMIRRALVDHARAQNAAKRGGGACRVTLHDSMALRQDDQSLLDLMQLNEALGELEVHFERAAKVVELRFFAGLSVEETAEVLEISPRTVKEDWRFARAWLRDRMDHGEPS